MLLDQTSGALANLSTARAGDGEILLFPSTTDPLRRGVLRLASRSGSGEVRISAIDEAGQDFGPAYLDLEGERTVTLDSYDLEFGNAAKGMTSGLGSGEGDWRLFVHSYLDLDVFSYARTEEGTISAVGDSALTRDRRHHVPFFNAARELHTSRLRLINPSTDPAEIRIQGWDDEGQYAPNGDVRLSLPAKATRTLDALDLQYGADGVDGSLGVGDGNWRLLVDADQDIHVMSLVTSTEGDLTNISSTSLIPQFLIECVGGSPDSDDDGIADHCDEQPQTALRPLSACGDGTYVASPGSNQGLARDCRVLIGFANYQAQNGSLPDDHAVRLWGFGSQQRIDNWDGIEVSGNHRRVTSIRLRGTEDQPAGAPDRTHTCKFGYTDRVDRPGSFPQPVGRFDSPTAGRIDRTHRLVSRLQPSDRFDPIGIWAVEQVASVVAFCKSIDRTHSARIRQLRGLDVPWNPIQSVERPNSDRTRGAEPVDCALVGHERVDWTHPS